MKLKAIISKEPFIITKTAFYRARNAEQINGRPYLRQIDFIRLCYILRPVRFVK